MSSVYFRPDRSRWYASIRLASGRWIARAIPESPRHADLTRTQRIDLEIRARDLQAAFAVAVEDIDFETACGHYLAAVGPSLSPATLARYKSRLHSLAKHVDPRASDPPLSAITTSAITAWRDHLLTTLAPNTVRNDLRAIGAVCSWLVDNHWIDSNPVDAVAAPRKVHRLRDLPADHEIEAAMRWESPLNHFTALGALAGLRIGDIMSLTPSHADLTARRLYVLAGKSKRPRPIPMHPHIADLIAACPSDGPWLYPWPCADHTRANMASKAYRTACRREGYTWSHHALRHWFIDRLRLAGLSESARLLIAGHADSATHRLYQHPQAAEAQPYIERLWPAAHDSNPSGG